MVEIIKKLQDHKIVRRYSIEMTEDELLLFIQEALEKSHGVPKTADLELTVSHGMPTGLLITWTEETDAMEDS